MLLDEAAKVRVASFPGEPSTPTMYTFMSCLQADVSTFTRPYYKGCGSKTLRTEKAEAPGFGKTSPHRGKLAALKSQVVSQGFLAVPCCEVSGSKKHTYS